MMDSGSQLKTYNTHIDKIYLVIEIAAGDLSKWWGYRKEQDMGLTLS
jgi:hypothetical protein